MKVNAYFGCSLVLAVAVLSGCSSQPGGEAKKAESHKEQIRGKSQIVLGEASPTDAAMNAGGQSAYIWQGARRYRLFLRTPFEIEGGKEYVVEGIDAQKVIDEIGDPAQGANGYPLDASCQHAVAAAWPGLAFDVTDGLASTLRSRVKRYPARPVFLVTKIALAPPKEGAEAKNVANKSDDDLPEVPMPADKAKALMVEGATTQPAPLWEPKGANVNCKVIIDKDGKVSELETGTQLCEAVPWDKFKYQPQVQKGKPIKVKTEVAIAFEPRKAS